MQKRACLVKTCPEQRFCVPYLHTFFIAGSRIDGLKIVFWFFCEFQIAPRVLQYTICPQECIKTLNSPLPPPPLLSLCGSIFSCSYMITTSWICKLKTLYLYIHTMSPTDRDPFQYLANYVITGSRVCSIQHLCPLFRHIHLAPKELSWSAIYDFASENSPGVRKDLQ
jgi:hypothetical protein